MIEFVACWISLAVFAGLLVLKFVVEASNTQASWDREYDRMTKRVK